MTGMKRWTFGAALALGCVGASMAHDDATLATMKAPNGGQLRVAGPYHLELVVARDGDASKDRPLVVIVTDHAGKKIETKGASGTATLLSGSTRATVPLQAAGDNRLQAMARYDSTPDLKAVVSIAMPGKAAEQARFTPLAAPR